MSSGMVPMFSNDEDISHYELSRSLGKGGFATVYAARRKADGLLVACKKIDRKKLEQEDIHYTSYTNHRHQIPNTRSISMIDRLRAEISIHHQVKHHNIVELLNWFEDDKYVYLILELCSRGDLEHYLKEKITLNEHETQTIAKQIVDGLVYLHSHGIIHRDIKLSNLLLTETLEVKIADFGLAKKLQLSREQNNETMCGTPNYISPEIASRTPHSLETDVWSLGILIATLLTGRPPFDTDTIHGTLNKVTQEKYELPTTFSEEAQDLVNSTLKKIALLRPNMIEIRDHPFFFKDFLRLSHSYNERNNYKKLSLDPNTAVDRSIDSGLGETLGRQRSTISSGSNSTSVASGTHMARAFSSDPISSPRPSHPNEPMYRYTSSRNKTPHDRYLAYPVSTSTPSQQQQQKQPIYAGQSPSFDVGSKYTDWKYSATTNLNDLRPTSATSSVRSQDSGVAQSDPKTSHDFSTKSETSPQVSHNNNNNSNHYLSNNYSTMMARNRLTPSTPQQQVFDTNTEQIRDKLQPLNTQRLKTHRQGTKTFIMSIMENGEVILETIRTKGTKRRIVDVFRVSNDGLHIITYAPNSRHGSPATDHPPPIPRDKNAYQEYYFDQLPSEYWKKYQYAHKFVTVVRSRTPKIVLYTPDAKCSLMETGVDFEAVFLCGVKITIYRDNFKPDDPLKIKILNNDDKSESLLDYDRVTAPNISAIEHFSPEIRQMIDNAIMCYQFCLSKDKILEDSQKRFSSIQVFPVQFGKKHVQSDPNRPTTPCSIGRTVSNQFGGSSSTVNELCLAPSSSSIGTPSTKSSDRREFGSETDVRIGKNSSSTTPMPSSTNIRHNNVQHSSSSSTLHGTGYPHHLVTYTPQSSLPLTAPPRPNSVHPSQSYIPNSLLISSLSNRQSIANTNNIYSSTTPLNSTTAIVNRNNIPLTRKSIIEYPEGTYRVTFSDNSVMILYHDRPNGQEFIDTQGKRYVFDRYQENQPNVIQERLALMSPDDHDLVDYTNSQ